MRILLLILLWPCLVIAQTYAGGLQSMRSPHLVLSNQDIILNLDQVKVSYTYTNTANTDITETLVFMLPVKSEDNRQFAVTVNQAPVQFQVMQHVINAAGRDITKEFKTLYLPINPIAAIHTIDASPNRDSIIARLRTMNLIDQHEDTPTWTVRTYYYWQQTFPAQSKIHIEQTFKPSITTHNVKLNSFMNLLKLPVKFVKKMVNVAIHWSLADESALKNLQEQFAKYYPRIHNYCPTKEDYQTLVHAYKLNPHKKPVIELKELNFAYGENELWANPVNRFNLTIESPKNMYPLLCWNDQLKRAGNNALQFSADNYIPAANIAVLYVEK